MRLSNQPAHPPARAVKVLARRADSDGEVLDLGGDGGDARERLVVEAVVDLVREDDDVVLDTDRADALELFPAKDLADGVVPRSSLAGATAAEARRPTAC